MIDTLIAANYQEMIDEEWLLDAARAALHHEGTDPGAELSVVISDDTELRSLNNQFLGIDAPTDVLSFPAGETNPESGQTYLGDIIISYPRAAEQAEAGNHSLKDELQLLVVHGVLHLLGYDHVDDDGKTAMWRAQNSVLSTIGNPNQPSS